MSTQTGSVIKSFPHGADAKRIAAQYRLWFVVLLGLVFGPVVVVLAWLIRHSRISWKVYIVLLGVSVVWLVVLVPEVQASGFNIQTALSGGLGRTIVMVWIVTIPLAPMATLSMHVWDDVVDFIRPKALQEHLEEQERMLDEKNKRLSWDAEKESFREPHAQRGRIPLGVFVKGDRFPEWLGLSRGRDNWITMDQRLLSQHMLVLGTTGAGKSVALTWLVSEVLRGTDRDIFIIDGKGEERFARDLANLMYAVGRGPIPIFKLGHSDKGSVYHGFRGEAVDIYNRLCALVGVDTAEGAAQYYADVNRDLLQLICYAPGGPPRSFEEARRRLNRRWLTDAYASDPEELHTIEEIDGRTLQGLLVRMRPLVREFAPLVGPEGFVLEETCGAIFSLRTQSVGDTARRLLHFLVEDVKDFVGKRQKRPGLLVIDEFGAFNNENIVDLLTLARSSDLGIILATQDIASLGDERTKRLILANTRTKLLMATDFPEEVAELAGTIYQLEASIQHTEGDLTGVGSARVQQAFRVDMNESARLQAGEAFLIRQRYAAKIKIKQTTGIGQNPAALAQYRKTSIVTEETVSEQPDVDDVDDVDVPKLEL